jgi:hypothetical protein
MSGVFGRGRGWLLRDRTKEGLLLGGRRGLRLPC